MNTLELWVHIGWVVLLFCGLGWLSYMLYSIVDRSWGNLLASISVICFLGVVASGIVIGRRLEG